MVSKTTFVDAGILVRTFGPVWTRLLGRYQFENLSIGASFKDIISTPVRLRTFAETEALNVKLGASWHGLVVNDKNHGLLASADVNLYRKKPPKLSLGLEYNLFRLFFIRSGYNQSAGFVLGAGVFYSFSGNRFKLDYSLGLEEPGMVHRIALTYQFGRSLDERREAVREEADKDLQVKIGQAVEEERKANEDRIRGIESAFSNNLRQIKSASDQEYQVKLDRLKTEQDASNRANGLRINEQSRLKLEKALADATNSIGQQNRDRIEELKRQAEEQRLEELRQNDIKARQELTNQRRILLQQQQEEIDRNIRAEKTRADLEKKQAVEDEQRKAVGREQKIRTELKTVRQDLLKAQDLLFEQEDFDAAIALLEDILRRDPANQDAREYLARARGARTPPSEYPQDAKDEINAGLNSFAANRVDEAIAIWQKALDKYPDNWRLFKLIRDAKKKLKSPPGSGQVR